MAALLDLDALEPWSSSQPWKRSTSRSASRLAGLSVRLREVGVEPIGGRLRLVDETAPMARMTTTSAAAKLRYTIATEKPRGIPDALEPRTSGSSSSAISAATRKRKTT